MQTKLVEYKFSRPNGTKPRKPSQRLQDALHQLAGCEEMRSLFSYASATGRRVVVQVFASAEGHPLLIHFGTPKTT